MRKSELLARIAELPEDAEITFAVFEETKSGDYVFRLHNLSANIERDPADVIVLTSSPIKVAAASELSKI